MKLENIKSIGLVVGIDLVGIGIVLQMRWGDSVVEFILGCIIIVLLALINIAIIYGLVKEKKTHLCVG